MPARYGIPEESIIIKNKDISLHGWRVNRGQQKALIYFGGNAEDITDNIDQFKKLFKDYTIYLINYRGYGESQEGRHSRDCFLMLSRYTTKSSISTPQSA